MANPKVMCVYRVFCTETRRSYVGATTSFAHRKRCHLYDLRHQRNWIPQMQDDFNTYGEGSFQFLILERISYPDDLPLAEKYWMDEIHPEYNKVLEGGKYASEQFLDAGRIAVRKPRPKQTPEHIAKRVASMVKNGKQHLKRLTEEQKAHLSELNRGKNNPNYGLKRTDAHKAILMDNITRTLYTFRTPDGNVVQFRNLVNFAREHNVNERTLRGAIRSPKHVMRGWEFISREKM